MDEKLLNFIECLDGTGVTSNPDPPKLLLQMGWLNGAYDHSWTYLGNEEYAEQCLIVCPKCSANDTNGKVASVAKAIKSPVPGRGFYCTQCPRCLRIYWADYVKGGIY